VYSGVVDSTGMVCWCSVQWGGR